MIFEVNRQDFRETRVVDIAPATLSAGQVRLSVERFAFTSNNISYAVAGDMLDYWGFFPAEQTWGHIPAIGIGSVIESANPDIAVGGRYFGFYPMAGELVIDAHRRGPHGFRDVGPHRANHAVTYTDFRDVDADESWDADRTDEYLLLWGMFMTSFLVDDQLGDRGFAGAAQTLVTSASSKTSISLASCLAARSDIRAVGLTSERNRSFVENLDLYDQVITYDEVAQLDPSIRSGVVDMAGNASVRASIHRHFGDNLTFSTSVGATHWEAAGDPPTATGGGALPGAAPEFFFAPSQRAKRVEEWGAAELDARIDRAYRNLVEHST
ncbi:MAG: DUF2855 family protein, partial [Acidimicrobiales bacterium]|nr:DUF2855 family protein [Acidimicrobiales bacterium]